MKSKSIISIIIVIMVIAVNVMPVFALLPDQIYPHVFNALDVEPTLKAEKNNYIVFKSSSNTYTLILSNKWFQTDTTSIHARNYDSTYSKISVYNWSSQYTKWIKQFDNDNMWSSSYPRLSGALFNVDRTLSVILSTNTSVTQYNNTGTITFPINDSQYTESGYVKVISNLLPGQIYPSVLSVFDENQGDLIRYPYHVVYYDSEDNNTITLLVSKLKLSLNTGSDYQFYSQPYNVIYRYKLDVDEWVNKTELTPMSDIGHLDLLPDDILYSNYSIYDPENINRLFYHVDSTHGTGGFDDEHLVDDRTFLEKMQDFFSDITDLPAFLLGLFIPSVDETQDHISNFKDMLAEKLGYQDYIDAFEDLKNQEAIAITGSSTSLTGTLSGVSVDVNMLDLTWFNQYRTEINNMLYAVVGLALIIFNVNQIYKLLNSGGTIADGVATVHGRKGR